MNEQEMAREVRDNPEGVATALERAYKGTQYHLQDLLPGDRWEAVRAQVLRDGKFVRGNREVRVQLDPAPADPANPRVMAIAAVSRNPGLVQDAINLIDDLRARTSEAARGPLIRQYWQIYQAEGLVNNAIEKYASLLSTGGRFKVRKVRRGKQRNALERAQGLLDFWCRYVNTPPESAVVTADRGVRALSEAAIRTALVEGDYMGRQVWMDVEVPPFGRFSLPMIMQTISMEFMEPYDDLGPIGEMWYWRPSGTFVNALRSDGEGEPEIRRLLKQVVRGPVLRQLLENGRALLTPALLTHVRHRGTPRSLYGLSFIEAAKFAIRYYRSVVNTDLVSMESVINRLMIVMVGSSDPASPYSKTDVALARTQLMQSFFEDPGPNMTIVWQGDDVKVENVGAMDQLLDLRDRHEIGQGMVKNALGIPEALLAGTTSDGRAAGWAAFVAASGMAEHLGGALESAWTILGERMLVENGFTDIDVVFEFDRSNLGDKAEERNLNRQDYLAGLLSIKTVLTAAGIDADAEFRQKAIEKGLDPDSESTTWESVFLPPQGLPGQGEGGIQGGTPDQGGRPSNTERGAPAAPARERRAPAENR